MTAIEKITMHNFKSFKKADCILGNGVIEITGPNGSGKSNIVDAIKFCLGEMNMKSLRAKSIKDLINEDANIASVTLKISNPNIEIKRIMNREGKVVYKINDEKVRRSDVINFLYTIGLDPSFYNIIPQGQVQKIVEMDAKKRRELIDSLSGIGEYEEKKKEALRELETVQQRINEAQLVLGERTAYLDSLQKEKEIAEQYIKAKEMFTLCRVSILKKELISYQNELKINNEKRVALNEELKKTANSINQIEAELKSLEERKLKYINKIQDISKKEEFNKELANANAELKVIENQIGYLEKNKNQIDNEINEINKHVKNYEEQNDNLKKEIAEKSNALKTFESSIAQNINEKKFFEEIDNLKNELIKLDSSLSDLLNKKSALLTEIGIFNQKINDIKNEINEIDEFINEGKVNTQNSSEKTKKQLLDEKNSIENKIKNLFQEEKNLNNELPELDKKILELKEKVAELRISTKANPLQSFVNELKNKVNGIHGFVYELIDFDDEYSEAIYASGGNRINYLVVENLDVAKEVFEILRRNKYGRITCIPLKELKINEIINIDSSILKQSLGLIKDYVKAKDKYRRVLDFVFGNTILVNDFDYAKSFTKNGLRIVTLNGELFEPSNIVSGGFSKTLQFNISKLEKLEKELNDAIERKKFVFSELQRIRNEMNDLRQKRTELDIKLKEFEVVDKLKDKEFEEKESKKEMLENELKNYEEEKVKLNEKLIELENEIENTNNKKRNLNEQLEKLNEAQKKMFENEKLKSENLQKISQLKSEVEILREKIKANEERIKDFNIKKNELLEQIKSIEKELKGKNEVRESLIKKINDLNLNIKIIEEEMGKKSKEYKELEDKYQNLSNERGKLIIQKEKLMNDLQKIEIKLAQTETKFKDLETELKRENLEKLEILELPKEELENKMKEAEKILNEYGAIVNLKAPEIYAEKAKSVLEAKEKVDKLNEEREAIMKFISEIEEKKKDIFINTFTTVNENFRKIFKLIFTNEEGYLELDKPNNPFDSGLHIKVIRDNKKRNLESLSGGEKSMLAILLILSMHATKTAPFYIFDEADAALDKENSKKFGQLIRELAKTTQIIVITHNDIVLKFADKIIGVTKNQNSLSEIYGIALKQ